MTSPSLPARYKKLFPLIPAALLAMLTFSSCSQNNTGTDNDYSTMTEVFGGEIDPSSPFNYAGQPVPDYIQKDNSGNNTVSNAGATLGRVLFYDRNLSIDQTISCASCHRQAFAFSDTALASSGVNGSTGRHSMRLVNARFSDEVRFFWDERASTLEEQTTTPIQDHVEMGFSGENGDPGFAELIDRMEQSTEYYPLLFQWVYGDTDITEERIQQALAQFVRSIQSFDSPYDEGRSTVQNDGQTFPNFTAQENQGKTLFLDPPQFNQQNVRTGGGFGCAGCHRPPEFDIDPNSENNGVIGSIGGEGSDLTVTRSPTLRDLFNNNGELNGPMMHTGEMNSLQEVLAHYNEISAIGNPGLDRRLVRGGEGQQLEMTEEEAEAVIAFLKTLSGSQVYTGAQWSDPFIQ